MPTARALTSHSQGSKLVKDVPATLLVGVASPLQRGLARAVRTDDVDEQLDDEQLDDEQLDDETDVRAARARGERLTSAGACLVLCCSLTRRS